MGLRKTIRRILRDSKRGTSAPTDFTFSSFIWLLNRPPTDTWPSAVTESTRADDAALISRVMAAYKKANADFVPSKSFWDTSILKLNADVHDALMGDDEELAASKLRKPKDHAHFWGFDSIATAPRGKTEPHQDLLERLDPAGNWEEQFSLWNQDKLITFAEAIGARKLHYPESPRRPEHQAVDHVIDQIEASLGRKVEFPNPYAGEFGLKTKRGAASFRALQSIYQAWRIAQIAAENKKFSVLEIGAGLGRTAFFANMFGVQNYTLIDVPLTNAAQGYFLGRTLGADKINLYGENTAGTVNIVPASSLNELDTDFDLVVNVDSLTEMDAASMASYWEFILKAASTFLSINHDENERSVSDLYRDVPGISVQRHPYWMRRGYVEELVTIQNTSRR